MDAPHFKAKWIHELLIAGVIFNMDSTWALAAGHIPRAPTIIGSIVRCWIDDLSLAASLNLGLS